jgi:hypothetical protein
MEFEVESWSRPNMFHDIRIDKRTGIVECTCEWATYRVLRPHLLDLLSDDKPECCKHVRSLVIGYQWILETFKDAA